MRGVWLTIAAAGGGFGASSMASKYQLLFNILLLWLPVLCAFYTLVQFICLYQAPCCGGSYSLHQRRFGGIRAMMAAASLMDFDFDYVFLAI